MITEPTPGIADDAIPQVNPNPPPRKSHRWSPDGETCLDCGDKDWRASSNCRPPFPPTAVPLVQTSPTSEGDGERGEGTYAQYQKEVNEAISSMSEDELITELEKAGCKFEDNPSPPDDPVEWEARRITGDPDQSGSWDIYCGEHRIAFDLFDDEARPIVEFHNKQALTLARRCREAEQSKVNIIDDFGDEINSLREEITAAQQALLKEGVTNGELRAQLVAAKVRIIELEAKKQ